MRQQSFDGNFSVLAEVSLVACVRSRTRVCDVMSREEFSHTDVPPHFYCDRTSMSMSFGEDREPKLQNKTGRAHKAIDQLYLVAGAGFEPTTFGL